MSCIIKTPPPPANGTVPDVMRLTHILTPPAQEPEIFKFTAPPANMVNHTPPADEFSDDPADEKPVSAGHAVDDSDSQANVQVASDDAMNVAATSEDPAQTAHADNSSMAENDSEQMPPSSFKDESISSQPVQIISEDIPASDGIDHDDREFECANDAQTRCMTGQYKINLSRKVISDHFGRNKACTRVIDFWPLFCRKHYQRATYNNKAWQARKISLILEQFDEIDYQIPGTLYNVAFKKSEENRLNTYARKITMGVSEDKAAEMVEPQQNGKNFEAPINVLRDLEANGHLGKNKTSYDVKNTVAFIKDMLENDETANVPSIEFLPQLDRNGNVVTYGVPATKKTVSKKTVSKKKASSSRVSSKGKVTKSSSRKSSGKSKLKVEVHSDADA
ncbi:unnamed protein product [Periconia digitata]|uniref:Uncharacterized protein n=1 Tax=Periconia digitata TaxID=1303443 RepID=A0A9W4U9U0_9PLEO|nr:unnamed protein product [Periconia digitata]